MKMQFNINLKFDDSFEQKVFSTQQEIFGPDFRKHLLGFIGHLLKLEESDKAMVETFIIKKLPDDCPEDPDVKNDISGAAK